MDEHKFDTPAVRDRRDEAASARAADLVERMLDEIARPDHAWWRIRDQANSLAQLAAAMTSTIQ